VIKAVLPFAVKGKDKVKAPAVFIPQEIFMVLFPVRE
jgi:hypothetical protein